MPGRLETLALRYHGAPRLGVTFIAQPPQIYTVFATSEWMPCIDDPSDKATLDLTIAAPSAGVDGRRSSTGTLAVRAAAADLRTMGERTPARYHPRGARARTSVVGQSRHVEHRFGLEAYDRLIAAYRSDYERVRDAGFDKPLVFPDWSHPTADDRTLVYRKGAYVLAMLRNAIGDDAFWAGLRSYTRESVGRSVTTGDLRAHMQRAAGTSLTEFFLRWVL